MKFNLYKRGSKGVSYVCAVKRNFRSPDSTFSDSVQGLIEFIEQHPNIPVPRLAQEYLGIEPPRPKADKPAAKSSQPDESAPEVKEAEAVAERLAAAGKAAARQAGAQSASSTADSSPVPHPTSRTVGSAVASAALAMAPVRGSVVSIFRAEPPRWRNRYPRRSRQVTQ